MPRNFIQYTSFAAGFLAVTLLAGGAFAEDAITLPSGGSFIIPVVESREIFKQCSRNIPQNVDGFWEPTTADIKRLEDGLLSYLQNADQQPPARAYNRQYVGFVTNGVRYIYGNFYPVHTVDRADRQDIIPVLICHGGPSFWGVVYRVDTQRFDQLAFNGNS